MAASDDRPATWRGRGVSPAEILRFHRPYGYDEAVLNDGGALVEALEILVHEGLLVREGYGYRAVPDPGITQAHAAVRVGAPPSAGVIGADGMLTAWRDGEAVELVDAHEDPDFMLCCHGPKSAWETPHGIVLHRYGLHLVTWSGARLPLGEGSYESPEAVSADGRRLAAVSRAPRRRGRERELHLIDLVDGSHEHIRTAEELIPIRPGVPPSGTRTFAVAEDDPARVLIRDSLSGPSRTFRLPEPVLGESAVWEDDEHLLLDGSAQPGIGHAARVYRLRSTSGAFERASFCGPGHSCP
ncbi:hypothetical protein EDD29_5430 [Actinocorallia herbida]|uniref:Uncharacterized protein n=1 Tax=Actinocorallia herbida TaxID=58109 RepID=A0A3N1D2S6_9ACTN|nr:hypothetical protein [Actinocorallia herbida]ROO87790.1 hypothetical protein EDD29_5430 [Actinocorallia herbida]